MVPRPETTSIVTPDCTIEDVTLGFRRRKQEQEVVEVLSTSSINPVSRSSYGLGRLRFRKSHGILGVLSLPCVVGALLAVRAGLEATPWVCLAVILTAALGASAIPLLKQVPKYTVISRTWNIVPPHREAFRRTIAIVGYLDLRLSHELLQAWLLRMKQNSEYSFSAGPETLQSWFSIVIMMYYFYFFMPQQGSFDNGNTWVFVVPMFLGFGVDVFHQLKHATRGIGSHTSTRAPITWNDDVVNLEYLLWTLLATQIVAFMFTLGFRNLIPIRYGYWIAAGVVLSLCAGMGLNYHRYGITQLA